MAGLMIFVGIAVPIIWGVAILRAGQPPWWKWMLLICSIMMTVLAWVWFFNITPSDGTRFYGGIIAAWFTWPSILALAAMLFKKGK